MFDLKEFISKTQCTLFAYYCNLKTKSSPINLKKFEFPMQHTTSSNLVNKIITLIILLLVALVSISILCTFVLEELLSTFGGGWSSLLFIYFHKTSFSFLKFFPISIFCLDLQVLCFHFSFLP